MSKIFDIASDYVGTFMSDQAVIFQAGAHRGEICIDKFKLYYPNAKIYSFEPCKSSYEITRQRIQDEKINNVSLYNFGLSRSDCQGALHISTSSNTHSLHTLGPYGQVTWPQTNQIESVQLRSIDSFCRENNINNIDYLYLNIESHELDALRGAANMLKNINSIVVEMNMIPIWNAPVFVDLDKFLRENGFSMVIHNQRKGYELGKVQIFALYMNNSTFPR